MNSPDELDWQGASEPPNKLDGRESTDVERAEEDGGWQDLGGAYDPLRGEKETETYPEDTKSGSAKGPDIKVEVVVDDAEGSHFETSGVKVDSHDQYQTFIGYGYENSPWSRDLTQEDFETLGRDQLLGIDTSLVVSPEQLDPIVECLVRHRVAMVVGERGVGKGALGQLAAGTIAAKDPSVHGALISSGLDRGVRIRLETLFEKNDSFVHRILLFEDVTDSENEDMTRLVERLDEPRLEALEEKLKSVGAYLLLTSDSERSAKWRDRLQGLGILSPVSPLPVPNLLQLLHQRREIRRTGRGPRADRELDEIVKTFLDTNGEELAGQLRTVPRIVYFVDHLLGPVAQNKLSLEEAFDRMDGLEHWLLSELPTDPPMWSFVLALVLASTDPRTRWIPWLPLHSLWREVEALVDKELGREEVSGPKPLSRLVVDRRFLSRARAQSRRLDYPLGEAIGFKDPAIADRLWRALLGPGRSIVAILQPRLLQLAAWNDPAISVMAARALGRIGELDPRNLGPGRFDAWFDPEKSHDRFGGALLLGEMLVGAAGSDDRAYYSGSRGQLCSATGDDSPQKAARALVAFVPLGTIFPERTMEILGSLVQRRLSNPEKKVVPLGRRVYERLDALTRSKRPTRGDRTVQLHSGEVEDAALAALAERPRCFLVALQFTLVGICFGGEPIAVLEAMARWMRSDSRDVAPWIAFLSLRGRGVLGILEDYPLRPPSDDAISTSDDRRACSRILLAADDDGDIAIVAEFLEAAHEACEVFPLVLRSWLRGNLAKVLLGWMVQGADVDLVRPCAIALLARLLEARNETLRKKVFDLVQQRAGESQDFALEVLRAGAPGGHGTRLTMAG